MTSVTRIGFLKSDAQSPHDPVATYLNRLAPGSRRAMNQALRVIAAELGGDLESVPWHLLRYPHTQAVRSRLMAAYAPASANKALSALKGVLQRRKRCA
jgi:hypothetical protein